MISGLRYTSTLKRKKVVMSDDDIKKRWYKVVREQRDLPEFKEKKKWFKRKPKKKRNLHPPLEPRPYYTPRKKGKLELVFDIFVGFAFIIGVIEIVKSIFEILS